VHVRAVGVKSNDSAKYVELSVECLRTRVRSFSLITYKTMVILYVNSRVFSHYVKLVKGKLA